TKRWESWTRRSQSTRRCARRRVTATRCSTAFSPGRELRHDRGGARPSSGNDRQPDLPLPLSTAGIPGREENDRARRQVTMSGYDEIGLAELLAALPPAPRGWVQAAQELPLARLGLDDLVRRAEEDADFRGRLRSEERRVGK